ncbi:hypothetical protein Acid7E03_03380 [Acidisoma sp. 7E03]
MLKQCLFGSLLLIASMKPLWAADVPAAQLKVQDMLKSYVTDMGYTPTYSADKSHFYFDVTGKYDYHIDVTTSPNGELVYMYYYVGTPTPAQKARIPYQKILEFQASSNVFFFLTKADKVEDLYVQSVFGGSDVTLVAFRGQLDHFRNALDQTDALWNPKLWK